MDSAELKDFKVYVFLNTIRVSPEQREAIHRRLRRNQATAVWVYATGYIDDAADVADMSALTGIKLAEDMSPGELHVDVTNLDHPMTRGLPQGLAYGTDERVEEITRYYDHQVYLKDPRDPGLQRDLPGFRVSPRFYVQDSAATMLGRMGSGLDPVGPSQTPLPPPGLVVKKVDGFTSIYCGAPILPASLLRGIAREAGVHIYSDADDVVTANRSFLSLYAPDGGTRTVRLPERATVVDLLQDRVLATDVTEFELELAENTAVLLRLERGETSAVSNH